LQATSSLSTDEILDLFNQKAQRAKEIIESRYSGSKLRPYVNGMIHFGMLSGSIGYMRILAFDGPNIRVPVFPGVDRARGRDGALERAIKVLADRNPFATSSCRPRTPAARCRV
jgi:hypothetical protein